MFPTLNPQPINHYMKTLDTRDLYARKCELESLRDALNEALEKQAEAQSELDAFDPERPDVAPDDEAWHEQKEELEEALADAESEVESAKVYFGDDEIEELEELETLENEISDFRHGETMIPESDFEDYARQFAEDIGAITDDAGWPCTCIDWERAADELRMDYSEVEYQGTTYLARA
jgi:DNA repair exonuclease SbcCD ATPase subunit